MLKQLLFLPLLVFVASTAHLSAQDYFAFSLRPGCNIEGMKPTGEAVKNLRFKTFTRPFFSLAMDIDGPGLKNFFIRTEIAYYNLSFNARGADSLERCELVGDLLSLEMSTMYRVPSKRKVQFYTGLGFGIIDSDFRTNEWRQAASDPPNIGNIVLTDVPFVKILHAGIMYSKRLDLNCKFRWLRWTYKHEPGQRIMGKSIALSISYRLFAYN